MRITLVLLRLSHKSGKGRLYYRQGELQSSCVSGLPFFCFHTLFCIRQSQVKQSCVCYVFFLFLYVCFCFCNAMLSLKKLKILKRNRFSAALGPSCVFMCSFLELASSSLSYPFATYFHVQTEDEHKVASLHNLL